MAVSGVSGRFQPLSRTPGQVPTRYSPVRRSPPEDEALDLHVLGAPPAFVLSQDQTLSFIPAPTGSKGQNHGPDHRHPMTQPVETHQKMPKQHHRRLNIPSPKTTYHVKQHEHRDDPGTPAAGLARLVTTCRRCRRRNLGGAAYLCLVGSPGKPFLRAALAARFGTGARRTFRSGLVSSP